MEHSELIIWSTMLGGLLTLAIVAVADVAIHGSREAWRGFAFMLTAGLSCMLFTGLVEHAIPSISWTAMLALRTSLVPLSGALALIYLGLWMGAAYEDRLVHACVAWGSKVLLASAATLGSFALVLDESHAMDLVAISALVSAFGVVLGAIASARAAQLGDSLARWMAVACVLLAVAEAGLFANLVQLPFYGDGLRVLTALSTVAFFLVCSAVGYRRSREIRRLSRLAKLSQGADPATGLPRGSVLLAKVDDAFWRSARLGRECTVVCLHIRNLYGLGDVAGHQVDQQILVALAARLRRAVGFRHIVGLYHPRCFVVVISGARHQQTLATVVQRLSHVMTKPLTVVGDGDVAHHFLVQFGIGTVKVEGEKNDPATVIDQAERLAAVPAPTTAESMVNTQPAAL